MYLDRVTTPMTTIGIQELPIQELRYEILVDLLREFQSGTIRKPDHFNHLHFLLFLLYDSHGFPRDRYPLWRWYHRIKKKLLTARHLTIDSEKSREEILSAFDHLLQSTSTISTSIEEQVPMEAQYLHSPIFGLFQSYSVLHTYLYLEKNDEPILNDESKIFQLFQSAILRLYRTEYCDLIHFAITQKKTTLLNRIFGQNINWLDQSINLVTRRGWLPLHYATYVGDKDTVGNDR